MRWQIEKSRANVESYNDSVTRRNPHGAVVGAGEFTSVGTGEASAVANGKLAATGIGEGTGVGADVASTLEEAAAVGVELFDAAAAGNAGAEGDALGGGDSLGTGDAVGEALAAGAGLVGVWLRTSTRISVPETSLHARCVKKYRAADPSVRMARLGFHFSSRVNSELSSKLVCFSAAAGETIISAFATVSAGSISRTYHRSTAFGSTRKTVPRSLTARSAWLNSGSATVVVAGSVQ